MTAQEKHRHDQAALIGAELTLDQSRATAIQSMLRLRDLEFCRSNGLLNGDDYELALLRDSAAIAARQYQAARQAYSQARRSEEQSAMAFTRETNQQPRTTPSTARRDMSPSVDDSPF